ncbi:hypothetical protein LJR031_007676 [Caballeronia sp. LjRoot31]
MIPATRAQQAVLMDLATNSLQQTERSDYLQSLNMCENGFALGSPGNCLSQASLLTGDR